MYEYRVMNSFNEWITYSDVLILMAQKMLGQEVQEKGRMSMLLIICSIKLKIPKKASSDRI